MVRKGIITTADCISMRKGMITRYGGKVIDVHMLSDKEKKIYGRDMNNYTCDLYMITFELSEKNYRKIMNSRKELE